MRPAGWPASGSRPRRLSSRTIRSATAAVTRAISGSSGAGRAWNVGAFGATLEEISEASLLLHVVDASAADLERRIEAVREVLDEIDDGRIVIFGAESGPKRGSEQRSEAPLPVWGRPAEG
ncbi:MAG: hypothetical protein JRS35_28685 [Deltaproteobacteria bacterium]|nr:hypothetical protein [Deltaproteobacteria bacterium]